MLLRFPSPSTEVPSLVLSNGSCLGVSSLLSGLDMDASTSRDPFHVSKTQTKALPRKILTPRTGRFPLAFQCIPAVILVSGIWFLQESPRWLCEKDRWEEARAVLQKLHHDGTAETDQRIELEFREIRDVIEADRINNSTSVSTIFTKASWRKRLLLGCGVQAFGPLSGINVINYYGPEIYKILGIDNSTSLMIIGISGSLSIVYCTIGLWALERFGRVKPLIISAAGLGAALVCNAAMSQHLNPSNGNMLRAMVAMNFVFSLFYTPLGIISWVYPAEIFPVEVRAFGNATTTFTNWTLNLIFAQFTPQALDSIGFRYFYVFFVFNIIAMLCYIFFYPGKFEFACRPKMVLTKRSQKPRARLWSRWTSCSVTSWYPTLLRIQRALLLPWRRMALRRTRRLSSTKLFVFGLMI